jgi:hypothetical protein
MKYKYAARRNPMQEQPIQQKTVHKAPDSESQEAIIFGSSYSDVKALTVELDHCMKIASARKEAYMRNIDMRLAAALLGGHEKDVWTDRKLEKAPCIPGYTERDVATAIWTLREIGAYTMSVSWMQTIRDNIIEAGKLIGACENSVYVQSRHSEDIWRTAANRFGQKKLRS